MPAARPLSAEVAAQARQVLEALDRELGLPPACGVALEGSLAEGLGTPTSDFDVSIVSALRAERPPGATALYVAGRRAELCYRDLDALRALAARIGALAPEAVGYPCREIDEIHEYQRIAGWVALRPSPLLDEVARCFDRAHAGRLIAAAYRARAGAQRRLARACLALGAGAQADRYARMAVEAAGKWWVAERGETYLSEKFLSLQLERLDAGDRGALIYALISPGQSSDPAAHARRCLRGLDALGLPDDTDDSRDLRLVAGGDVAAFRIAGRVHLVRAGRELFALSRAASALFEGLRFGAPAEAVRADLSGRERDVLCELFESGLVGVAAAGRRAVLAERYRPAPLGWRAPFVSPEGACFDEPDPASPASSHVRPLPIDARSFATAGGEMVWNLFVLANRGEDAAGARAAGRWRLVEVVLRARVRDLCAMWALGCGVAPRPSREASVGLVARLPGVDPGFARRARELEHVSVAGPAEAERAIEALDALHARLPQALRPPAYAGLLDSAEVHARWVALAAEWRRLAQTTGAAAPLPEPEELAYTFFGSRPPRAAASRAPSVEAPGSPRQPL